ncbi:MAG TPA: NnrU family protein [Microvirga sp.]|jgi:uncharacterized membrane protein|nr:NnrU family protein [Microvirga sp.]
MTLLILGLVLFIGTHAFTMARGPRGRLRARLGEGPYKGLYSLLSLAGIVLVSVGYGAYRAGGYVPLWDPPVWTRHLALLLVWFAFVAFVAAYLPGRIKARLKHPMLAGVKIWALAHLLANGDLGSVVLFGSFLAWAVAARISTRRRDEVVPHGGPAAAPAGWRNDVLALAIGTIAYLAFAFWLHPWLIGVAVMPTRG